MAMLPASATRGLPFTQSLSSIPPHAYNSPPLSRLLLDPVDKKEVSFRRTMFKS